MMNLRRHSVAVVVTLIAILHSVLVMPYLWFNAGVCGYGFNPITVATGLGLLFGLFSIVLIAADARKEDRILMYATALVSIIIVLILGFGLRLLCFME